MGVSILIKNTFECTVHDQICDKEGNYLILDITIQECRITFVALYGPNNDSPNFFSDIRKLIENKQNSSIIMVGDWNVVQDYDLDTCNYKSKNNVKAQQTLIEIKESLDLVDIWRAFNPDKKRYTWRGPDLKQSRLDYFLISTDFESIVKNTDIDVVIVQIIHLYPLLYNFITNKKGGGHGNLTTVYCMTKIMSLKLKNALQTL